MVIRQKKYNIKHDYTHRVNAVIDYIDSNLDTKLDLNTLADISSFSPFHFHRIFKMVTGETPNILIVRKRIEKIASILLTTTDYSFSDLAFKYGFSNGNALSRAFKKFYGINPTNYKEHFSKIGVKVFTYEEYICDIDNIKELKNGYINRNQRTS